MLQRELFPHTHQGSRCRKYAHHISMGTKPRARSTATATTPDIPLFLASPLPQTTTKPASPSTYNFHTTHQPHYSIHIANMPSGAGGKRSPWASPLPRRVHGSAKKANMTRQPAPTPSTTRSLRRRRRTSTRTTSLTRPSSLLVRTLSHSPRALDIYNKSRRPLGINPTYGHEANDNTDKKARDELAGKVAKGKGPLNTGSQGIKKSGKK